MVNVTERKFLHFVKELLADAFGKAGTGNSCKTAGQYTGTERQNGHTNH